MRNVYDGEFVNGLRHGYGTFHYANGASYSGYWNNNMKHGKVGDFFLESELHGGQLKSAWYLEILRIYLNIAVTACNFQRKMLVEFQGKFLFKNGRIYEGMFEHDHIVEYPDFRMNGTTTPDISGIRTRTPLPSGNICALS